MKEFRKRLWYEVALCASFFPLIHSSVAYTADVGDQLIAADMHSKVDVEQDTYTVNFNNIAIIEFIPMTYSGISMRALGMDLTGGPIYPRKEGICLMMISMPIAINMPSTTEMGKNSAKRPALKTLKITWMTPTIAMATSRIG